MDIRSRKIDKIVEADNRYKMEAYDFVLETLAFTLRRLEKPRHVSAQELLEGIREYALEQFGVMTRAVFEHWGINSSEDFGEIVFNMVVAGLMSKTVKDSKDDFKNGYNFEEVFGKASGCDFMNRRLLGKK